MKSKINPSNRIVKRCTVEVNAALKTALDEVKDGRGKVFGMWSERDFISLVAEEGVYALVEWFKTEVQRPGDTIACSILGLAATGDPCLRRSDKIDEFNAIENVLSKASKGEIEAVPEGLPPLKTSARPTKP